MRHYIVDFLLIISPFVCGYLVNNMMLPLYPLFMQLLFFCVWLYAGMRISKWNLSKWKSFIVGNSLWLISFALFFWQFFLLDDTARNLEIAFLAQHYMLPFVYGTAKILPFLSSGTSLVLCAYLFMIVIFSIGFIVQTRIDAKKVEWVAL